MATPRRFGGPGVSRRSRMLRRMPETGPAGTRRRRLGIAPVRRTARARRLGLRHRLHAPAPWSIRTRHRDRLRRGARRPRSIRRPQHRLSSHRLDHLGRSSAARRSPIRWRSRPIRSSSPGTPPRTRRHCGGLPSGAAASPPRWLRSSWMPSRAAPTSAHGRRIPPPHHAEKGADAPPCRPPLAAIPAAKSAWSWISPDARLFSPIVMVTRIGGRTKRR